MSPRLAPIQVLLIEDNVVDARFVRADFENRGESKFVLHAVETVDDAAKVLQKEHIDVILLDLFLKQTQGLETISAVRAVSPDLPVVVLTSLNDEELALQALKHGAQDYLTKGTVDSHLIFRAIRYAIERKQGELEKRLLEARYVEMQKLEAIGTLAGGVAHNFNNMMMVVLGHSHFLLEKATDEDAGRHIEAIVKTANRASALTRQLVTFSRRDTGQLTPADLNEIIHDIEELIRSVLHSGIDLALELDPSPVLINADANQIQHMLMSLVLNARDAIGDRGRLGIRTEWNVKGSQAEARLTVTDNGCGMSAETRAHIFEPFFTTKGFAVAAGLGLSTVYGIVEQHTGRIEVDSGVGAGTSFSITFPGLTAEEHGMNPEDLSQVLDRDVLMDRLGRDYDLLRELAALYLVEYPKQLEDMRSAVAARDLKRVHQAAHKIKGTARSFAAAPAADAAHALEQLNEFGDDAWISRMTDHLELELHRLQSALEDIVANL